MKEKSFEWWTRKEFEDLPNIEDLAQQPQIADSLVILPTRNINGSGFREMNFVVIVGGEPICKLAGSYDLMKIGASVGRKDELPTEVRTVGWGIDCLRTSGLIRIFCKTHIKLSDQGSTFELHFT